MIEICNKDCANCKYAATLQGQGGADTVCENLQGKEIKVLLAGCADRLGKELQQHLGSDGTVAYKGFSIRPVDDVEAQDGGWAPDVIIDVVDCRSLESSLLRTTHLMDTGRKMVMAFDYYEEFTASDHAIKFDTLSLLLGFPVVTNKSGIPGILKAIVEIYQNDLWLPKSIQGRHLDDDDHARIGFVHGALLETIIHSKDNSAHSIAHKVDAVLTNKWLGFPLLILVLFAVFEATFALGAYPQQWIENGVDLLATWLKTALPAGWLTSMLADGIVQGVGAVLAFLPNIAILFFFLSILEDSGYMSRAAYVMDKVMHHVGLHGNSFIPMLIGFGCNVPAIMATRSIQNTKDRTLTMLMIPFMSCSARLPVYMLFVSAFFVKYKALVMMGLYITGIVLSILFAFIMKRTKYFRKGEEDYVSELPPFHAPKMRDTWAHIWDRIKDYLQKISSVILIASVVIWALEFFPAGRTDGGRNKEESCLAMVGKAMEPAMAPLGFDWKMNVCVLTGLPAKEAIVSTMGILYHTEDEDSLVQVMRDSGDFNFANSIAFLLFVLLYFPCIATISTIRKMAGRKWAAFTLINSTALAWVVAFAAFQIISILI